MTETPRHLHIAIGNATRAIAAGDDGALGTINEDIQPLVDAAMARIRRTETKLQRAKELARRLLCILRHHNCEDGGLVPGELLIITMAEAELQEVSRG